MERLSVFDIFKIGVGPSSSHTLGPWKAARAFVNSLDVQEMNSLESLTIDLYGSLSKTGKGHGTDVAVILGLMDYDPITIDTSLIDHIVEEVEEKSSIKIRERIIGFSPKMDISFRDFSLDHHPNSLQFTARFHDLPPKADIYYSVGGGFIEKEGEDRSESSSITLPFPIDSAAELLKYTTEKDCAISDIVFENEKAFSSEDEIAQQIKDIYNAMLECVHEGCHTAGILPGGLNVRRRAKKIADQLIGLDVSFRTPQAWMNHIGKLETGFNSINKWISCFALAVNEVNASFGRVVTSPTNGAAGVIPAVMFYYYCFCRQTTQKDISRFLYTSGEIGSLFKKGATISAAVGGCQAEIGVSSAMAAGGLTELLGGSPQQVMMAAEIAMEHHLGMTCDPIGGLVQIPCIERNAMGAMKAITASNIALSSNPEEAIVSLDDVIKTMWDTAQDMNTKYKETSEGGLAFNLPVIQPSC